MIIAYDFLPQHDEAELERMAELQLRRLHISGKLTGLRYLSFAVARAIKNPEATCWITKELYFDIAHRYATTPSRVERSIRTAIKTCWSWGGQEALDQMAGYHLSQRPSATEFIDLVAAYLRLQAAPPV